MTGENQAATQGGERGQKSKPLSEAEGGILDQSEGYEMITTGVPEKGAYTLVGGYLEKKPDGESVLHNKVFLRAMSGHEEDLLSNDGVPFFTRMTGILAQCCERIGDFVDRKDVIRAIRGLPAGSRQHLLICLRRTSHWRATKDIYDMKVECPKCEKVSSHKVNLADLERFEMPDPLVRMFEETLPDSGKKVVWRITESDQDEIISAVVKHETAQAELLTWSILIRLVQFDGETIEVKPGEVVDPENGNLLKNFPKRVLELRQAIKNLSVDDRQYLRDRFEENEPGIDTDLDFKCPKCKREFLGRLDLGQRSFFFPSGTQKRSKRRSFI